MSYEDYTAHEVATALESLRYASPEDTAGLSLLDEATLRWAGRFPELSGQQRAFAQARQAQWPRSRSAETWQSVLSRANELAAALRDLGDVELTLCRQQTQWGTCKEALADDGQCPRATAHLPA